MIVSFAVRVGGLETTRNWSTELSPGEQQRLAIARLLTRQPRLAFLDEATSALDLGLEAMAYSALLRNRDDSSSEGTARCGMTVVSVGHRPSLLQFHTHVLSCETTIDGAGKSSGAGGRTDKANEQQQEATQWVWQTVAEYRARTGL
jgi:ABC-type uncharacterized transport system fused permease/ATPase subunit